jgi:type IX secretion system PorP/SprF family membrane protein
LFTKIKNLHIIKREPLFFMQKIRLIPVGFCVIALLSASRVQAQDPVFTQFYAAPLQLNPAFAGNAGTPFIAINYRSQWAGFNNAFTTSSVSYDQGVRGHKNALGISVLSDDAGNGIYKKSTAAIHYSYKVNLTQDIIAKIGVSGGAMQTRLDWDKLIFYDQLDPVYGATLPNGTRNPTQETRPLEQNRTLLDISTGFLVYTAGYHVGLSAKHLNTPDESFLKTQKNLRIGLPILWMIHGGYEWVIQKGNRYRPTIFASPTMMIAKQGDFMQINAGVYAGFGPIFGGLWYRQAYTNSDAAIVSLGFQQDFFKIGYSYDLTISGLAGRTGGSHEIALSFNLDPYSNKKWDYNDCFRMFR